ncbi:MAG: hypothetical protein KC912_23310 [Proteobacteria bacterium]|nr:hypothetical protein [Pseudomonadota bacterium]
MILWLGMAALAQEGEPVDVRRDAGRDAVINWSELSVEVETRSHAGGAATRKSAEAEARKVLGPRLAGAARLVGVTTDITLGDLEEGPALGASVATRMARWYVSEARYYSSGRVELVGELDLRELLKPWTLSGAEEAPARGEQPSYTGLIVDARGLDFEPVWAPSVRGVGATLWTGTLWEDVAYERAPVVYVSDAAHPAAMRAGNNPMFVRAASAEPSVLELADDDAVRVRTAFSEARTLGDGTVVVVVDP